VVHRGHRWFRDTAGPGDSNVAEWRALLFAVELALAAGATDALFVGDSALVIAQASRRQRCRSPHLAPYLAAFDEAVAPIARVRLRHVPRSKNLAGIALARRYEHARGGLTECRARSTAEPC